MKKIFTLISAILMSASLWSNLPQEPMNNTSLVTFYVNMEGATAFDPQIHQVYISGSFSGWPIPGTEYLLEMQPMDTPGLVYWVSIELPEGIHHYKYFLVAQNPTWSLSEWSGDNHRPIFVNQTRDKHDTWGVYSQEFIEMTLPSAKQVFRVGEDEFVQARIQIHENLSGYNRVHAGTEFHSAFYYKQQVTQQGVFDHFLVLEPSLSEGQYRFYLYYELDGYKGHIYSDWFFIENKNAFIQIGSPNSHSSWLSGEPFSIYWDSRDVASFDILYSLDNGQNWHMIAEDFTPQGYDHYHGQIPADIEGFFPESRILIRDSENHQVHHISQAFLICNTPFVFVKPGQGQVFDGAKDEFITLSVEKLHDAPVDFSVYLLEPNYWNLINITEGTFQSAGMYDFQISTDKIFPGQYELKLAYGPTSGPLHSQIAGPTVSIINNKPGIHLVYPYGRELWISETNYDIAWVSNHTDRVNIYYSTDDGSSWKILANEITSPNMKTNTRLTRIPHLEGVFPDSFIKIQSALDPKVFAISQKITLSEKPVKILNPNSHTVLAAGNKLPLVIENRFADFFDIFLADPVDKSSYMQFSADPGTITHTLEGTHWWSPGYKFLILRSAFRSYVIYSDTFLVVPQGTTYEVTFNVDMSHEDGFDADNHHVYITGDFTNWTLPGTQTIQMQQTNTNPLTYSLTRPISPGFTSYKYFSDAVGQGWLGGEWHGTPYREVNINATDTIHDIWGTHQQATYTLNLLPEPENAGVVTGAGIFNAGQEIALSARSNSGFRFLHWRNSEGSILSSSPEEIINMPAENISIIAEFSSIVNVEEIQDKNGFSLFPNPASSLVYIMSSENIIREVQITDINGRLISTLQIKALQGTIAVSNLEPGLYLLKILTESGNRIMKRMVVLR